MQILSPKLCGYCDIETRKLLTYNYSPQNLPSKIAKVFSLNLSHCKSESLTDIDDTSCKWRSVYVKVGSCGVWLGRCQLWREKVQFVLDLERQLQRGGWLVGEDC